jgi:hypothetical protein
MAFGRTVATTRRMTVVSRLNAESVAEDKTEKSTEWVRHG